PAKQLRNGQRGRKNLAKSTDAIAANEPLTKTSRLPISPNDSAGTKNGSTRTTGTDQPGKISPTATKNKHYLRSSPARTMHVPSSYLGKQTVSKAESTPWSKTSPVITVA